VSILSERKEKEWTADVPALAKRGGVAADGDSKDFGSGKWRTQKKNGGRIDLCGEGGRPLPLPPAGGIVAVPKEGGRDGEKGKEGGHESVSAMLGNIRNCKKGKSPKRFHVRWGKARDKEVQRRSSRGRTIRVSGKGKGEKALNSGYLAHASHKLEGSAANGPVAGATFKGRS